MKKLIIIILLFIISGTVYTAPIKVTVPLKDKRILKVFENVISNEMGKIEVSQNKGTHILKYGTAVYGKPTQYFPYCYALVYYSFSEACKRLGLDKTFIPILCTGHSNTGFNWALKNGKKVKFSLNPLDIIIFKYGNNNSGHTATIKSIIDYEKWIVWTYEGNTSANEKGSQDNGGCNTIKKRFLKHPLGRMFFRGVIGYGY